MTIEPMIEFIDQTVTIITIQEGVVMGFKGILKDFDNKFIYLNKNGKGGVDTAISINVITSIELGGEDIEFMDDTGFNDDGDLQ